MKKLRHCHPMYISSVFYSHVLVQLNHITSGNGLYKVSSMTLYDWVVTTMHVKVQIKIFKTFKIYIKYATKITRMWANAQPDGHPAEHRWRPLFNAAKFS